MMDETLFQPSPPATVLLPPRSFGRGLAVVRIFFGIILFANGMAKVIPDLGRIDIGAYHANLVTRDGARGILNFEVNNRQVTRTSPKGTEVPGLRRFVNNVVLAHWGFFGWFVTVIELGVGALLIFGLVTRLAALIGLGQQLFLAAVYFSSTRWMFEQPHEYIPLIVLALVPAGRIWGVDGWLTGRSPRLIRWPF